MKRYRLVLCSLVALNTVCLLEQSALAENWPQWRGPHLNGSTTETNLPTKWSTTENVAWVVDMPGPGGATPIIWGDHLFMSSENRLGRDLVAMCFHSKTGKLLWQKCVVRTQKGKRNNTMASPSAGLGPAS